MSISATETSITYAGNASSSTPYPITFRYFDSDHISVYADGVEISHRCTFAGDGNDNTGQFTTYFSYAATVEIVVVLDVPLDQPTVLQENQLLPAKTIEEDGFDRLNMQIRRAYRWALGALRFDNSEGGASTGTANSVIGFDNDGNISDEAEIWWLSDVNAESPGTGEVLMWDGTEWINSTPNIVNYPSSGITYTPAGAGAVDTTMQAKLRESVSVQDFGAVGDGVADDTVAIQAALDYIDSVGGGSIYIPATRWFYNLTETLYISSYTKLYGDGHSSSLNWTVAPTGTINNVGGVAFSRKGITNKDYLDQSGNYQSNTDISIEDLRLEQSFSASGLSYSRWLVRFFNATNTAVKRCRLLSDGGAVVNTRVSDYYVEDNEITIPTGFTYGESSDGVIDQWDGSQYGYISGNSIDGADYLGTSQTRWSILLTGSDTIGGESSAGSVNNITITNNTITGCGWAGIELAARADSVNNISITNNNIYGLGVEPSPSRGRGIIMYGCTNISIIDNHIYNTYRSGINFGTEASYPSLQNTHITVIGNIIEDCIGVGSGSLPIEFRDCTSNYVTLTENDVLNSSAPLYQFALGFAGTSFSSTYNSNFSGNRLQTGSIAKCNKPAALGFNTSVFEASDTIGVTLANNGVSFVKDTAGGTGGGVARPVFYINGADGGDDSTNRVQINSAAKGSPPSVQAASDGLSADTNVNLQLSGQGAGSVVTDTDIKPLTSNTVSCGASDGIWYDGYFGLGGVFINGQRFYSDSGDPNGAVSATVGSVYTRTDGGAGTTLYIKETGAATSSGWAAK